MLILHYFFKINAVKLIDFNHALFNFMLDVRMWLMNSNHSHTNLNISEMSLLFTFLWNETQCVKYLEDNLIIAVWFICDIYA